ncbi:MAG: STN domain-containing protein, partial [Leptospira sp.]|nr:STN domain-containing protein [Leptospira sp.]
MKKLLRQQWYDKILFLMKITVLQVFLSFLFGSLAYATELKGQEILDKKVTLHVDNVELKMVLSEIEKIADIKFAYSSRVVRVKQKISVDADGKKLSQLLTELLNPFDVSYQVIAGRISLFRTPAHQLISEESNSEEVHMVIAYTVSGRVVDDIGQSLPGVNVVE